MKTAIEIKGKQFTHEKPMICIPIVEETEAAILAKMDELMQEPQDMVEWRIDYFEDQLDVDRVTSVLEKLQEKSGDTILVATIRTKVQGGLYQGDEVEYETALIGIAASGFADVLDVEFFTVDKQEELFRILHGFGAVIISSHHDFQETPELDVMRMLLRDMAVYSDIVKLAVMPNHVGDVLDLLRVTYEYQSAYGSPIISMSMGKLGMVSRISGEVFGSCVTFGTVGKTSAPGQMERKELRHALDFMHEHYVD